MAGSDNKLFLISTLKNPKPLAAETHLQKKHAMASRFFRQAGDSDSDTESSDEESLMSGDDASKPTASAKPKSRFLRSGGTSDSESPSEEESDESEEEQKQGPGGQKVSRFLATGSDDDDSDEEVKRVVKSAKDKRLEEMEATGTSMNNALKINDWTAISSGELAS